MSGSGLRRCDVKSFFGNLEMQKSNGSCLLPDLEDPSVGCTSTSNECNDGIVGQLCLKDDDLISIRSRSQLIGFKYNECTSVKSWLSLQMPESQTMNKKSDLVQESSSDQSKTESGEFLLIRKQQDAWLSQPLDSVQYNLSEVHHVQVSQVKQLPIAVVVVGWKSHPPSMPTCHLKSKRAA